MIDHFFSHLHFIGDDDFLFAVPLQTDKELQARMFAAWKSYGGGDKSIDCVLQKYRKSWNFDSEDRTELQIHVDQIVHPAYAHIWYLINGWTDPPKVTTSHAKLLASAALFRMQSSFSVLTLLTRFGYGYEGFTVSRLILEQIAYVFVAQNSCDDIVEKINPTKCISNLKTVIPWIGYLYGQLSNYTHFNPKLCDEHMLKKGGANYVRLRRPQFWSPRLAWVFALLTDAYAIVTDVMYPTNKPISVINHGDSIELLPNRPTASMVKNADKYAMFSID